MTRFTRFLLLCIVCIYAVATAESQEATLQFGTSREHTAWVASVLKAAQTIKVGMTRADLTKLFTVEGGLSTPSQRTYVYKLCPYIKIDVKFAASSRTEELTNDKIVEISRPYLAWSVMD